MALLPEDLPRINEISLDWQVAAVALACSIGASLLLGLAPAWQLTRANPDRALRSGATADPAARALRSTLMAAEVGLAMVLLIGAGLLLRTFVELQRVDPGFPASRLLTFRLNLDPDRYPNEQRIAFFERLLEAIRGLPRVEAASLISQAPLTGAGSTARFGVIGRPADRGDEAVLVPYRIVEADYFRTAGVPLLRGRLLSAGDTRANGAPVVIDSALAREFFSDRDPIGQRIMLGEPSEPLLRRATIVGIVGEVKQLGLDLPAPGMLYVPQRVMPNRPNFSCVVRTAGDPFLVLPAIRTLVQSFDSSLPVAQVQTMEDLIEESLRPTRSSMLALAGFAGLALAMTGVGLFGVVTYVTSQRQREFAIRLTLGAQPRTLRRLVIGEGMRPVVIGLAAGAAGALGLARFARSLLYGVSAVDPIAVAGATVLVIAVAAAACYAPVLRATRVDPMMLLRAE